MKKRNIIKIFIWEVLSIVPRPIFHFCQKRKKTYFQNGFFPLLRCECQIYALSPLPGYAIYQTFSYFHAFNRFNFPGYKLCWLQSPMHTHQLQKQMQISSSQLVLAKNSKLNWSYLDTDGWNFVFFFHIEFKVEK